jgi:LysM repeat protein
MFMFGVFTAVFIAVTAAFAVGAWAIWESDWIMPGIQVFGFDLSWQSKGDAAEALSAFWAEKEIALDVISPVLDDTGNDGEALNVKPETLGMSFDEEATVELAYEKGRSLENLARAIGFQAPIYSPPVWLFDVNKARANLETLAPQYEVEPVDAGIQIIDGRVVVSPPSDGRRLDVAASVDRLAGHPAQVFATGKLELVTVSVQPSIIDLGNVAERARQLLNTTLSIQAFDPIVGRSVTWDVLPKAWSDWLSIEITDAQQGQLDWTLNADRAKSYLRAHVHTLGSDRYLDWEAVLPAITDAIANQRGEVSLRIYHQEAQHVVQAGETLASIGRTLGIPYPWILEANPGLSDRLSVGQALTIPSPDELLPLPVVENKRIRVSISEQKMWAYESGALKWEWPASTGIDSSPTSPGVFQIQTHESNAYAGNWNLWMPHFMGIYRPVPSSSFMNGFHGFPTRDGANLLWTASLGHQVTYGCILISTTNAAQLYEWAEDGVVVEVER